MVADVPMTDHRRGRALEADVLAQLPIGVLVVDADGRTVHWNDSLSAIWALPDGTTPDPTRLWARPGGESSESATATPSPLAAALAEGTATHDERIDVERHDGLLATVLTSACALRDESGAIVGAVATAVDVTEQREREALREAFVSVLSHELRTPITSIFGGAELLRREDLPPALQRDVLDDITSESERLHRLVEDLLVMARLERGVAVVGRDPVLLQRLVPRVVHAEQRHWPDRAFEIVMPPGLPAVQGEDGYLEQVLRNLVSNAAKYGPPDGAVEVRASEEDGYVTVRVLDEGPGIPSWATEHIFRLFYRLPALAARAPGAGIGLYVSRAIVQAMGGRTWAASRSSGGAEVGFSLPVYPTEAED